MPNHRSLSPVLGFDVSVEILPRKVVVCRDFILRAVATFWVMPLVGIYPDRASITAWAIRGRAYNRDLTVCYVMLCYVMLCYVMLCYVMLCYVMLCYVMLCYVMLCYVMLCCYVMFRYPLFEENHKRKKK